MERKRIIISEEERKLIICKRNQSNEVDKGQQMEKDLEQELIQILESQGYEYLKIRNEQELKANLRKQLERLNRKNPRKENFSFSDNEWRWFYQEYLEGVAENEGFENRTKKIQGQEFKKLLRRDNGTTLNINFIDKFNPSSNNLQVINQYSDSRLRYDVTILVNGLPLVHIELKKRGNSLNDAFTQIDRYRRCGFSKLFEFIQIFVISNGTETKYYSNTTRNNHESNSFLMTSFWASFNNETIRDLRDFARTFLEPQTILQILTKYCVFDSEKKLKILRPYQIAAIEGIIEKIEFIVNSKSSGYEGGYVWHTTGSGKTLTSFKAAQLALEIPEVKKVLFVVDRKDLDHQTTTEYRKFLGESEEQTIDSTNKTSKLKELLNNHDKRIIITTIQKLRILLNTDDKTELENKNILSEEAKNQRVVIIMDECHRSQTQRTHGLLKIFNNRCIFGFTGTPKFTFSNKEGKEDVNETENTFGKQIHSYKIVDAIKDENVLGFWIDYVGDRKHIEQHTENNMLESKSRIASIVQYIIRNFHIKTNQNTNFDNLGQNQAIKKARGFNSIFAVKSIDAAIQYYNEFRKQLSETNKNIKIAIIFCSNDSKKEENANYKEESFNNMELNHSEFLWKAIKEYKRDFGWKNQIDKNGFNYFNEYRNDVSKRVKNKEIDILIVVNMFLTGFDAPRLNTIWIDKNLEGHNLIQAFSRTNRIYDKTKPHGNIICFRNIKDKIDKALTKFASYENENSNSLIIVKGLKERLDEFRNLEDTIIEKFPIDQEIIGETAEKEFVKNWKEYVKISDSLKNDEDFKKHRKLTSEQRQDYSSLYRGIFEKYKKERENHNEKDFKASELEQFSFDLELLRSDEVDIDYILGLLVDYWKFKNRDTILRYVRTSEVFRPEEDMIVQFFDEVEKDNNSLKYPDFKQSKIEEQIKQLIEEEGLKEEGSKKFIKNCIKNKKISFDGTRIATEIMPEEINFVTNFKEYKTKWERVKEKLENIFKIAIAW